MSDIDQENVPRPSPNSYWVIPGRLAAGEYPGDCETDRAERKLRALIGAGIDQFIDLTETLDRLEPYAHIAEDVGRHLGVDVGWEGHPILDQGISRTRAQMTAVLDAIDLALDAGRTVYVHCWGEVGRTGTVVGCWLVRHGTPGDEALCQVDRWWRGMQKAVDWWDSPENDAQKEFVRSWRKTKDE